MKSFVVSGDGGRRDDVQYYNRFRSNFWRTKQFFLLNKEKKK